jgi:hypothetical protein
VNKAVCLISIAGLVLLAGASRVFSVTKPFESVGTHLWNQTNFPRGVRNIGMGAAGVAEVLGYSTGFFNPASFAWADATTLGASFNDWILDEKFTDTRFSAGYPERRDGHAGAWRFGGSVAYSAETIDWECSPTSPVLGCQPIHEKDYSISGSFAAMARRGVWEIGLGGTAKHVETKTFGRYVTWAFDLGAIAAADLFHENGCGIRPRAGVAFKNLGRDIRLGSLSISQPGENRYGVGLDVSSPFVERMKRTLHRDVPLARTSIDLDLVKGAGSNHESDGWAIGAEVAFLEMAELRIGMSSDAFDGSEHATYGFGLGWDFGCVLFQLDYARVEPAPVSGPYFSSPGKDVFGILVGGRI